MRKLLPLLVVVIFVLSGLGAVALNNDVKVNNFNTIEKSESRKDYTHTVLVEVGTRTTCPSCPNSNIAWKNIYNSNDYDFEYTELVYNKNSKADQRFRQFNPAWVPTSYFDGGQYVCVGTNYNTFYNYLDAAGSRSVPDLVGEVNAMWLGNAKIDISISIENKDNNDYPGTLRVYIIELESPRWNDYNGNPYWHAFLDFAWNQEIDINSGDTFEDNKVWDGASAGYSDISSENIQVILTVFDDTPYTSYSDPPDGSPFNAYYADETVATLIIGNQAPNKPTITGETNGKKGVEYEYTFNAVDPNGDNIKYYINWDDDYSETTGFNPSGSDVKVKHTWIEDGTYTIKVTAEDPSGLVGPEATLTVTMPKNKIINRLFLNLLQSYPILYAKLQTFLLQRLRLQ